MKSMTGFGRGEATDGQGRLVRVEVSSVNRKQSDIAVIVPRDLIELEVPLRKLVAPRVSRGRVTVKIEVDAGAVAGQSLKIDRKLAAAYRDALASLATDPGNSPSEMRAADWLAADGVFSVEGIRLEAGAIWESVEPATRKALDAWDSMRTGEGEALKQDLDARVKALREHTAAIADLAPGVVANYRENLHRRLREAGLDFDLDDERVLKEIGVFAERCDISEELTRLESHFNQADRYFGSGEPIGRSLDFLAQEMNREVNTIGSKANNAEIAQRVVEGKAEVEKIREQVQNIE